MLQSPPAEPGMHEEEVDTPALLLDLDAFEANLDAMAALLAPTGVKLRAHAKTHKSPVIARLQMLRGAVGQCVQKVGEAEALAWGGIPDILVSNQIVGSGKLARLAARLPDADLRRAVDAGLDPWARARPHERRGVLQRVLGDPDRDRGQQAEGADAMRRQREGFQRDLIEDLIPFVQTNYRVHADREHRAIAGLSLGGAQALGTGLSHLDLFSRVAGLSPALGAGLVVDTTGALFGWGLGARGSGRIGDRDWRGAQPDMFRLRGGRKKGEGGYSGLARVQRGWRCAMASVPCSSPVSPGPPCLRWPSCRCHRAPSAGCSRPRSSGSSCTGSPSRCCGR